MDVFRRIFPTPGNFHGNSSGHFPRKNAHEETPDITAHNFLSGYSPEQPPGQIQQKTAPNKPLDVLLGYSPIIFPGHFPGLIFPAVIPTS